MKWVQQTGWCILGVSCPIAFDARMCRLVQHLSKRQLDLQASRTLLQRQPPPACDVLSKVNHLYAVMWRGDLLRWQKLQGANRFHHLARQLRVLRARITERYGAHSIWQRPQFWTAGRVWMRVRTRVSSVKSGDLLTCIIGLSSVDIIQQNRAAPAP